jgi:hypothetical protein
MMQSFGLSMMTMMAVRAPRYPSIVEEVKSGLESQMGAVGGRMDRQAPSLTSRVSEALIPAALVGGLILTWELVLGAH